MQWCDGDARRAALQETPSQRPVVERLCEEPTDDQYVRRASLGRVRPSSKSATISPPSRSMIPRISSNRDSWKRPASKKVVPSGWSAPPSGAIPTSVGPKSSCALIRDTAREAAAASRNLAAMTRTSDPPLRQGGPRPWTPPGSAVSMRRRRLRAARRTARVLFHRHRTTAQSTGTRRRSRQPSRCAMVTGSMGSAGSNPKSCA